MKNVEDIYPASPMQQFMLLHSLGAKQHDSLFNQFGFDISEPLHEVAFETAWQSLIDHHSALRTGFIYSGVPSPQQVVRRRVKLPFVTHDWREFNQQEQASRLDELYSSDRERSFDLRKPPLCRIQLVRLADVHWHVLWSSHHLIIDRWSIPLALNHVTQAYQAELTNQVQAFAHSSFRPYIEWVGQQKVSDSLSYWRQELAGFNTPIVLPQSKSKTDPIEFSIDGEQKARFDEWVKSAQTTPSTLTHLLWALAFQHVTGVQDILYGSTVTGRTPLVEHVEDSVGSFVNNLPLRISLLGNQTIAAALKGLQAKQFAHTQHDYLSPIDLHAASELAEHSPLYSCLLIWLAKTDGSDDADQTLKMVASRGQFGTALPLTISAIEETTSLTVRLDVLPDSLIALNRLIEAFSFVLQAVLVSQTDMRLADIPGLTIDEAWQPHASLVTPAALYPDVVAPAAEVDASPVANEVLQPQKIERDLMLEVVRNEWQQVLSASAGLNDEQDFFALGGTSLQAAVLHTNLERVVGKKFPLLELFAKSTINGMTSMLLQEDWPVTRTAVTHLLSAERGPHLFCIASPEVNTIGYALLSRNLGSKRRVTVVQAPVSASQPLTPAGLLALTDDYLRYVRDIQPRGPYQFFSMCAGSHISLEMARKLRSTGEEVEFFGIVNTWSFYSINRWYYASRFINLCKYYQGRVAQEIKARFAVPKTALSPADAAVEPAPQGELSATQGALADALQDETQVGLQDPWIREVGFMQAQPDELPVDICATVFRIKPQPFWRSGGAGLGWERRSRQVTTVLLSGDDHDLMLREPYVSELAEALERQLAQCVAGESSDTGTGKT